MENRKPNIDSKYDISGLEVKPGFQLKWYQNEDSYSDGDIEDTIINHIIQNEPEDYSQVIYENFTWPTYYHLTHLRKNLLNWYPFDQEASVLEIGCGLGSITNMLCDRCKKVTAVELSKRRATATLLRCREKENLNVIVGNLNDIEFEEKFDYITLIGVLEYQGTYTNSSNPFQDFLMKIRSLLKPEGRLLVAIENQYGAKYWCGAREDHTGMPFDGMNQYKAGNQNARTFSREALKQLLMKSGYDYTYFYYPFPDYKLPTVVYSEGYLPKDSNMQNMMPTYIPNSDTIVIQEKGMYDDLIQNGVFEFFSNSFLVECSFSKADEDRVIFASLSSQRQPDYRIGTTISAQRQVVKFPLENRKGILNHLKQTMGNTAAMEAKGLKSVPALLQDNKIQITYMTEPTLEEALLEEYRNKNKDKILEYFLLFMKQIEASSEILDPAENILYELELDTKDSGKDYGVILKIGYLDMIPRNCFIKNGELLWYDQEWKLDKIPSKYIFYRGLIELYAAYPWISEVFSLSNIAAAFGLLNLWDSFQELNTMFIQTVMDGHHMACASAFMGCSMEKIKEHINKLVMK